MVVNSKMTISQFGATIFIWAKVLVILYHQCKCQHNEKEIKNVT